jgi:hypothetical protein
MAQQYRGFFYFLSVLSLILTIGCGGGSSKLEERTEDGQAKISQTISGTSDSSGYAQATFDIEPGTTAFSLTVSTNNNYRLSILSLLDPSGRTVENSASLLRKTGNDLVARSPVALNFPLDPSFVGPLSAGTYTIQFTIYRTGTSPARNQPFILDLTTKADSTDYQRDGYVDVNIILSGAVASDVKNKESLRVALGNVQSYYRDWGINLNMKVYERKDLPSVISSPKDGINQYLYQQISTDYPSGINLVFAVDIDFLDDRFADSGFTPLPAAPSNRSAAAFSVRRLAGADGLFDDRRDVGDESYSQIYDDETLQMSTVIAHEIGHSLGLKNTVDLSGEKVIDSDTLPDTEACVDFDNCRARTEVSENIMFPFSVRKRNTWREFWARTNITAQQAIVMKQNIHVTVK